MPSRIEIDLEILNKTIYQYNNNIEILSTNIQAIKICADNLQDEWGGEAKIAFFEQTGHYNEWYRGMKKQVEHLEFLRDQLNLVKDQFEPLEEQADKLKLNF